MSLQQKRTLKRLPFYGMPRSNTIFFQWTTHISECVHVGSEKNFLLPGLCSILGIKRKTESQVEVLMESFRADPYPRKKDIDQLADSLNISEKSIYWWFGNMRKKKSNDEVQKKRE